jgi:hypothetical protein
MENPWGNLPLIPPFVVDADKLAIQAFNAQAKLEHKVHLEVLPEPYLGNPLAPVVILNLNPGFGEETIPFHQRNHYFIDSLRRNLLHMQSGYPFYLLDPQNAASPGYQWWWKRLRILSEACGQKSVANGVFCVEYFPYASQNFAFKGILESQRYSFHLVRKAIARGAIIVMMRGERFWVSQIPELSNYSNLFYLNSVQSVYITPNNCPTAYPLMVDKLRNLSI